MAIDPANATNAVESFIVANQVCGCLRRPKDSGLGFERSERNSESAPALAKKRGGEWEEEVKKFSICWYSGDKRKLALAKNMKPRRGWQRCPSALSWAGSGVAP